MFKRGTTLKIADTSAQDVQLQPKSKRNRNIAIAGALLLFIVLVWMAGPAFQRWSSASISVPLERIRIATVIRADLVRDVSVQGRVVAAVSPTLYAPAAGRITLLIDSGASVEQDQILAIIDSPELASSLQQVQATLDQLSMELERQRIESRQLALDKRKAADLADVALVAANREKRRADDAHERKIISIIDYEKAQDDLRNAELAYQHAIADADLFGERLAFEIRASELSRDRQKLLVTELQRQVDNLSMRSPVSGIVGDMLVSQRAAVSRDTPVMAVVDLTQFVIDALVSESYADDLAIGMHAEILVAGDTYAGLLVAISPEIVANQVRTRIRFTDEMPGNIRQNQRLTTRILLEKRPGVLTLRRGQFLESGGGRIAYLYHDEGFAERREIKIGGRSLSAVEIKSGLEEGDKVIISSIEMFHGAESILVSD